ncbi:MAG TPA: diguanylate cyclase [Conexibacter sp.]|nr:diguanylate cyclase [Conexibacter sp.]
MSEPTATVPTALAEIWERHHAGVLEQVGTIEAAVVALMRGDLDDDRRARSTREAHKLSGSLGTFGLAAASERSRELELLLGAPEALGPSSLPRLSELVVAVRDDVQAVLPSTPATAAPAPPEAAQLLIVEDDLPLAERLAAEAARRGMGVELAASPAAAREVLARIRPAGVLLDLTFETGTADAYALLSELTGATPPVPVLVSTMRDTLTDRVEVVRRGGRGFVSKSLPAPQAIDGVLRLIERAGAPETTLLAVDDDPAVLDAVGALLTPHGVRVVTLSDPLRFWSELDRVRPDVILLDVDMPGVTGVELCRVLRNDTRWATVPVLMLTARRDPASIERIFAAGADDHLAKPVIGTELVTRVRNRVERLALHRALAETDSLTGVQNRQASTQALERLLRLATRYEQPLALAAIDLDRFKQVNDVHGHAAGDAVLRRFGTLLSESFRGEDVVGRWGGEEFIVGMYGMSGDNARERLGELLATLSREHFDGADGEPFAVAFSAGVARLPEDGGDLPALYGVADAMLYRAKQAGRAQVVVAGSD